MREEFTPQEKEEIAKRLLKIRYFEESLDMLFEQGVISGTYHRCIGQEASAVGVMFHLDHDKDFVISNHRNHGHYLAFTGDHKGLLEELKGNIQGVSGGRGGSQVIFGHNFISNGVLGSTIPIATGIALGLKRKRRRTCIVCFIGDGALGEGIVYEAFNMAALWVLPILYVVEYNHMVQSVSTDTVLAGSIQDRFRAFGIPVTYLKSTDVFEVIDTTKPIISDVRNHSQPAALIIDAQRLCAHSKGDDLRPEEKLAKYWQEDPILKLEQSVENYESLRRQAQAEIEQLIAAD